MGNVLYTGDLNNNNGGMKPTMGISLGLNVTNQMIFEINQNWTNKYLPTRTHILYILLKKLGK